MSSLESQKFEENKEDIYIFILKPEPILICQNYEKELSKYGLGHSFQIC